jgi:hypothetical protein
MTNSDAIKANFVRREIDLLEAKRNILEDIKEFGVELKKSSGLSKVEIAAVHTAAKRTFEAVEKREFRQNVELETDKLELALGDYKDTALGAAAMERIAARA